MRTEARRNVAITPGEPGSSAGQGVSAALGIAAPAALGPVPLSRYLTFGLLVVGGLTWDLGSKEYVFRSLGYPGRSAWEWQGGELVWFVLQTNLNFGALWGLGQGWSGLFAALSFVAVTAVGYFLFWLRHAHSWWLTVALGFVVAGAFGNLYDRLGLHGITDERGMVLYGVRDFLYFRFFDTFDWPIFNFADSFLVTGAIMLMIHSFRPEPLASGQGSGDRDQGTVDSGGSHRL